MQTGYYIPLVPYMDPDMDEPDNTQEESLVRNLLTPSLLESDPSSSSDSDDTLIEVKLYSDPEPLTQSPTQSTSPEPLTHKVQCPSPLKPLTTCEQMTAGATPEETIIESITEFMETTTPSQPVLVPQSQVEEEVIYDINDVLGPYREDDLDMDIS